MKINLKQLLLSLMLLGFALSVNAQSSKETTQRNTLFLELGGNGMFYSLNYDRILLNQPKWKISGRMGIMYLPGIQGKQYDNRHTLGSPLEVSYWRGSKNHHLEVGLGFTPIYDTYPLYETHIKDLALMGVARIGYRYQKREGGLFFKTGFTPSHGVVYDMRDKHNRANKETFTYPLIGLAIGYTLKG